jgi:hypothetical protein
MSGRFGHENDDELGDGFQTGPETGKGRKETDTAGFF